MDKLSKKSIEVSRDLTYTYYTSPTKSNLPTVLLCHGWPDTAELWNGVIKDYLLPAGYGIVALDCLGYGGTSKPTDMKLYNFQLMAGDIAEILDKENISKVVSLGHDWGSGLAQRFWHYHPDRVCGLVMVNVGYIPPSPEPFDFDKVIQFTTMVFGYGTYWYWELFTADDGPEILLKNIDSLFDVAHGEPETWLETMCKKDGVKTFLTEGRRQPVQSYATEEMRQKFVERMKHDKFDGPQQWYRATAFGVQDEANRAIKPTSYKVTVPTLFFGGTRDVVCRPEINQPSIQAGLLPHLKTVTVDAGHWSQLSHPEEFGEAVTSWLKENYSG